MSTRIVHVISGLGAGGAEFMLERLVACLAPPDYTHVVISLTGDGIVGERLRARGCATQAVGLERAIAAPVACARLLARLREAAPSVVQTWLCHADLLGGLVARYALRVPVVWGVHQAEDDPRVLRRSTRLVKACCARLAARVPSRVVSASRAGARLLERDGYPADMIEVIPNGVDAALFRPDPAARAVLRGALGVAAGARVVGLLARWHPDKDHAGFFAAADAVLARCPDTQFVLAGPDVDTTNPAAQALVAGSRNPGAFHLLGYRDDPQSVLAACDIMVQASRTEAFPNAVIEAMSCALPVVATAVGDVAWMVGDSGLLVVPGDPGALARALLEVLAESDAERGARGAAARARVCEHFSIEGAAARYRALYTDVLERGVRQR